MIVTHTSGLTTLTASMLNITFSERDRNRKASRDFNTGLSLRGGGQGFPPATRTWPLSTFIRTEKKNGTKEISSCLIPCLLVVFTRQLEISVTAQQ